MRLSDEELNKIDVTNKELSHLMDKTVTVTDLSNYAGDHQEKCPFEGKLFWITGDTSFANYWVRSSLTGNEYEIYQDQILELTETSE